MTPIRVIKLYDQLAAPRLDRALMLGDVLTHSDGDRYTIAVSTPGHCILSNPRYGSRFTDQCQVVNYAALTREEAYQLCGGSPGAFTFVGKGTDVVTFRNTEGGMTA